MLSIQHLSSLKPLVAAWTQDGEPSTQGIRKCTKMIACLSCFSMPPVVASQLLVDTAFGVLTQSGGTKYEEIPIKLAQLKVDWFMSSDKQNQPVDLHGAASFPSFCPLQISVLLHGRLCIC